MDHALAVGSHVETSPERRVHALAGYFGERPPSRSIHDRVKLFDRKKNALVGELSVTVVHDDPEETTAVAPTATDTRGGLDVVDG